MRGSHPVAREPGLHDCDGDGAPNILARDTGGRLWLDDTFDCLEQYTYFRADLYATDVRPNDQDPYLYKSTGAWRTPFAGRAEVSWFFTERRDYNLFA
ncbi:hypothetical protein OEB94_36710 [Streptomyces sp. ICN988]|uniref:hypothetical protein n=1 Tax=Streptomyces sp. ICN988 TaxID=2983765 RepID=UPI0021E36EEB|nr:hypothetical protein [Streptomyces sp. ICN988]MCV2464813.1 hypothetical protein [Streptomyces sp. ICN988]